MKLKKEDKWFVQVCVDAPNKKGEVIRLETQLVTNRDDAVLDGIAWFWLLKFHAPKLTLHQMNTGRTAKLHSNAYLNETIYQRPETIFGEELEKHEKAVLSNLSRTLKESKLHFKKRNKTRSDGDPDYA